MNLDNAIKPRPNINFRIRKDKPFINKTKSKLPKYLLRKGDRNELD